MATLLTILLVLCSLFLMFIVLLQRGRGGGLAGALGGMGGQSAFGTKAGDVFTRITVVVAGIWVLLNCLSIFANRRVGDDYFSDRNAAPAAAVESAPSTSGSATDKDKTPPASKGAETAPSTETATPKAAAPETTTAPPAAETETKTPAAPAKAE